MKKYPRWYLNLNPSRLLILLLFFGAGSISVFAEKLSAVALRCEYRVNPLGIDEAQLRLTWRVESAERGQKQTAYQILVASTAAGLKKNEGDLWDSGKIPSSQTVNVVYAGKALTSRQPCFWKVRVWDASGRAEWSEAALWTIDRKGVV